MAVAAEWKTDEEGGGCGQQAATPESSSGSQRTWQKPWALVAEGPHVGGWESVPSERQRNDLEWRKGTVTFPLVLQAAHPIWSPPTLGQEDCRSVESITGQMWPQTIPKDQGRS